MSQRNSSISNSDILARLSRASAAKVGLWLVIWLVAIDVLINIAFAFPADPSAVPSRLQLYFNYGRSQEGKLAQITRADPEKTAPITLSGWYEPLQAQIINGNSSAPEVTFYGMSHAVRLAHALGRVSDRYRVRVVAAPGATTNWAYGAYLRDGGAGTSRAVVLAFMSGNFPMLNTMSAVTWNTNVAMPYTADRFFLEDGKLSRAMPPYDSFRNYIKTFNDAKLWSAAQQEIRKWDRYYDSFVMKASVSDHSALMRLIRRAYAQHEQREMRHDVLGNGHFNPESEEVKVAQHIIAEFAADARKKKTVPVIFIANLLGDSNYLFQALKPVLLKDQIPFLSSDTIASPNDPRKYLPDTHFTDATDDEMGRALAKLLDREMNRSEH